jgi:uncharacterized membrane protein YkvA (DUF1232 family)
VFESLSRRARVLKRETYALYLACRDPRTPWYAKALTATVVAYAFSPIDLIPDFVPVLGYLDDLIVVPLGIALALKLVPTDVLAECRARASATPERPTSRIAAAIVVGIWIAVAMMSGLWLLDYFHALLTRLS